MRPELSDKLRKEFPFLKGMYGRGSSISCYEGWYSILYNALDELSKCGEVVFIYDIKEKWGTLRVSYSGGEKAHTIIDALEDKSALTCELCGFPGRVIERKGWYTCVCDMCNEFR